jgi:hypothetical protein
VDDIKILTPAISGVVNSDDFAVERDRHVTIQLYPLASVGANTATLKRKAPDGTYVTCYDDNGVIILSATRPQEVVVGYGIYRLECTARAAAWGASKNIG